VSWTYLNQQTRKGRKQYRCFACGMPIPAREKHEVRTGADGREIVTMRMHGICEEKTRAWDEDDWMMHDEAAFRTYELLTPPGAEE
jgi:hypothetical protein